MGINPQKTAQINASGAQRWHQRKSYRSNKVIRIHSEGKMNVCTKFQGDRSYFTLDQVNNWVASLLARHRMSNYDWIFQSWSIKKTSNYFRPGTLCISWSHIFRFKMQDSIMWCTAYCSCSLFFSKYRHCGQSLSLLSDACICGKLFMTTLHSISLVTKLLLVIVSSLRCQIHCKLCHAQTTSTLSPSLHAAIVREDHFNFLHTVYNVPCELYFALSEFHILLELLQYSRAHCSPYKAPTDMSQAWDHLWIS